jgi:phospholipid/cholesterol/gamma-HCH transport system substrate-binding protein
MSLLNRWTALGAAALVAAGIWIGSGSSGYTASVVLDSAANIVNGGPVLVNGFAAGHVDSIQVVGGKARVTFSLDSGYAPLHSGANIAIQWKATLSERQLDITDGAASNPQIPNGGTVSGVTASPVELDDILNALDQPTRLKLQSMITRLNGVINGHETNAQATVAAGGPALQAVGQLLTALGTDGPALNDLVTRTSGMLNVLSTRDQSLQNIVVALNQATSNVASRRQQLGTTLQSLPQTLSLLRDTLTELPSVAGQAVPLLNDLAPATAQLATTSRDLAPVMVSVRPLVANLKPALAYAKQVLGVAPSFLNGAHGVLPTLQTTIGEAQVAVNYLRGYTPEAMGFLSTWASAFANYDNGGNYGRLYALEGASSLDANPGVLPPGLTKDGTPPPGGIVNQPWTDAAGSGVQ